LPDATDTEGTTETVQGGLNLYNKYDYVKTTVTSRAPKSCSTTVSWIEYGSYYTVENYSLHIGTLDPTKYLGGRSYYWHSGTSQWQERFDNYLSFHTTAASAAAAITGGAQGSGISKAGNNLWQAVKVVRNDVFICTNAIANPHANE
jgi:predicted dehydrogenase